MKKLPAPNRRGLFTDWVEIPIALCTIVLCYILIVMTNLQTLEELPLLQPRSLLFGDRIIFYKMHSDISLEPFRVSVLASFLYISIMAAASVFRYRSVVKEYGAFEFDGVVSRSTFVCGIALIIAFLYIGFFFAPLSFDPRYPGMASVLFWPYYPALAITISLCVRKVIEALFLHSVS